MGLTPGGNLATPRHISYHLPWKLRHGPNYFVNIQGADPWVRPQVGRTRGAPLQAVNFSCFYERNWV